MANENQPDTGIQPAPAPVQAPPSTGITAAPPETAITLPSGPGASATDAALSVPMTVPAEEPETWIAKADWLLLGLVVALGFLVSSVPAFNSDVWMQMATGRLIAHGDYLPGGADPFSFATEGGAGKEAVVWVNHSWLFALGTYLVYSMAGGIGIIVVKGLLIAALCALMVMARTRETNLLILAICMTLGVLTLSTRLMFVQPVLISYLFLGVTLYLLNRAGALEPATGAEPDEQRARVLWALPVLFVFWVNLDNWFILGPMVVGICWAGLALQRWRGLGGAVPVRRIGIVFGVGLLACLVSPFHVRVFQLPPELAYLLVRAGATVGVPMPDALCAGGRTLAALREVEPQLANVLSPLAAGYMNQPLLGWNIAGMCVFVLLGLGAIAFVLNIMAAATANGPAPHAARFALWLGGAALALANFRLAPFFAIVAAPITAMTLSELAAWYTRPAEIGTGETLWGAPVRMARLLGVPLLLALLALAWLGWLHQANFDPGARRHVDWRVTPDASMRGAAERLGEIQQEQKDGRPLRVFSTGPMLPDYCAWFAPGVKCFFDSRYNLLAPVARDYALAKVALGERSKKEKDWLTVFKAHDVDHVAVENFLTGAPFVKWMDEADRWRLRYGDKQVAVFTWSRGERPWPTGAVIEEWNAQAFGRVPPSDRPPAEGPPPWEARSLFERYLFPVPPLPRTALEMDFKSNYGPFVVHKSSTLARVVAPELLNGLAQLQIAPGSVNHAYTALATQHMLRMYQGSELPFLMADSVPPAVPVLIARLAWQTVAEAPDNERCYAYLANAYSQLQRAENYWIRGPGQGTLRDSLRNIQIVAALRAAADIGVTDPRLQFQIHNDLFEIYVEKHCLDLAADHLNVAAEIFETLRPEKTADLDRYLKAKKDLDLKRKMIDTAVQKRRQDFKLKAASKKPLEKVGIALYGRYSEFNKDNKEQVDPQGLGLAGLALELLNDIDQKTLDKSEQLYWLQMTLDLLFNTGHARQAAEVVDNSQAALEHMGRQHKYQIFSAGARGDYRALRAALADYERLLAQETARAMLQANRLGLAQPPESLGQSYCMLSLLAPPDPSFNWATTVQVWALTATEYFNVKTLRGAVALEAGDTAEAHAIFQDVLRESSNRNGFIFTERRLAERYATFLERYHKK